MPAYFVLRVWSSVSPEWGGAVRVLLKNFFLPWTLLSSILTFVISYSLLPFPPLPFSQRRLLVRNSPSASPSSHLLPAAGPHCHSLILDF